MVNMLKNLGLRPQSSPDFAQHKPLGETETNRFSGKKSSADKTHGRGVNKIAKPVTKAVVPTVPKISYVADVNNGNANPKWYLTKPLPESTEAAADQQAVIKYVRVDRLGKVNYDSKD